jgi:hypothetical protein
MDIDNEREAEVTMTGRELPYMLLAMCHFTKSRGPLLPRLATFLLFPAVPASSLVVASFMEPLIDMPAKLARLARFKSLLKCFLMRLDS